MSEKGVADCAFSMRNGVNVQRSKIKIENYIFKSFVYNSSNVYFLIFYSFVYIMNGLIVIFGESFRYGNQNTRIRGIPESYDEQIKACNSHITFIEKIKEKYNCNSISVFIASYTTQYDADLLKVYEKYTIGNKFYPDVIGFNNLYHKSINEIENMEQYDFLLSIRIDIFLKDHFMDIFNPTINMILFPCITWFWDCHVRNEPNKNNPRVVDTILFIPKKYYKYIKDVYLGHELWDNFIKNTDVTYDDLDVMINTYHDSDSSKDFNPLYYIVNRPETTHFHSPGQFFNKYEFK